MRPSLAKLTLARIIAATRLRMWKDEEEYRRERDLRVMEYAVSLSTRFGTATEPSTAERS